MLQYGRFYLTWLRSLRSEEGQDLAEYALLLALIAIAVVVVLAWLSGSIAGIFNTIALKLESAPADTY